MPLVANELIVDAQNGPYKTIQEAVDLAQAGDTVLVKPGVYCEEVTLKHSGTKEQPIVIKSEVPRGATLDGSDPVTGWKKVESAESARGAKNWDKMFFAEIPAEIDYFTANIYEGDTLCSLAQDPAPPNIFYSDDATSYHPVPPEGFTGTSITAPDAFNQKDPKYWDDAGIYIHSGNNNIFPRRIESYDPATGTITYADLNTQMRPDRDRYALVNQLDFIARPGDFAIKKDAEGRNILYYWPHDPKALETVRISTRKAGFRINRQSYVHIVNFKIRQYSAGLGEYSGCGILSAATSSVHGMLVRGNEIYHCKSADGSWALNAGSFNDSVIEENIVRDNQISRGIGLSGSKSVPLSGSIVRNNIITHNGGTGINFYYASESKMLNNLVYDNHGHHANGLTVYLECDGILIDSNIVINANISLTLADSKNLTVTNNVFYNPEPIRLLAVYRKGDNITVANNTIVNGDMTFSGETTRQAARDNIFASYGFGFGTPSPENAIVERNISTKRHWDNTINEAFLTAGNVIETDLSRIFKDVEKGDFTRVFDGPLMEAGSPIRQIDLNPPKDPWAWIEKNRQK